MAAIFGHALFNRLALNGGSIWSIARREALTLAGILLIMVNGWIGSLNLGSWVWIQSLPLGELGGTLFGVYIE